MKKLDILTWVGVAAGSAVVLWGILIGSSLMVFYDFASVVITIFGSLCALLINYPLNEFKRIAKVIAKSFTDQVQNSIDTIQIFTALSRKARKEGLLSLEDEISLMTDEFLKRGLQMVVDGIEPETIRDIMELEIDEMEKRHKAGAGMLKAWAAYAPAFGMIGTLIGLIQMLVNLSDSSKIASGMAVALITTFYGAVMANLILTPMASKLSYKSGQEASSKEMMIEGILAIQSGVNPRIVEEKLICYLDSSDRKKYKQVTTSLEGVEQSA
jgi:chemotaxis protein MotA